MKSLKLVSLAFSLALTACGSSHNQSNFDILVKKIASTSAKKGTEWRVAKNCTVFKTLGQFRTCAPMQTDLRALQAECYARCAPAPSPPADAIP